MQPEPAAQPGRARAALQGSVAAKAAAAQEKRLARVAAKDAAAQQKLKKAQRKQKKAGRSRPEVPGEPGLATAAAASGPKATAAAASGPKATAAAARSAARPSPARPSPARPPAAEPQVQQAPVTTAGVTTAEPPAARTAVAATRQAGAARRKRNRRRFTIIGSSIAALVVVALAASGVVLRAANRTTHTVVAPTSFSGYKQARALAGQMKLPELRRQLITSGGGEATHVVDAVYENAASGSASGGPQFILFIAGNLSGASASSFVSSFVGKLPGAVSARPGQPFSGAAAACAPSRNGSLTECAWADGDTFGVLGSPNLSVSALGQELRQLRPLVERPAR